jgi:hypothetical protein
MPSVSLPDDASLEQLRKQAKDVRDLARAGVPGALALVAEYHPKGAHPVTLTGAQLVVARHNGFASWARLKQHLGMIERYRRCPDEVDQASGAADEFLAFACVRFGGDDGPSRWERAARVLAAHPELTRSSIYAAAAAGDEASVRAQAAARTAGSRCCTWRAPGTIRGSARKPRSARLARCWSTAATRTPVTCGTACTRRTRRRPARWAATTRTSTRTRSRSPGCC